MCVACRTRHPKSQMLRVVRTGGKVFFDKTGESDGRGAYICPNEKCLERAIKSKAFSRALKCEVGDVTQQLRAAIVESET